MKYEKLIDLEFTKIGCWKTDDDGLNYEVFENKSNEFEIDNSLYIFFDSENDRILYVGKTTQTLKKGFMVILEVMDKVPILKYTKNLLKKGVEKF